MSVSILEFWLSSLNMSSYHQTFIDNGYDDLEISKKVYFVELICKIRCCGILGIEYCKLVASYGTLQTWNSTFSFKALSLVQTFCIQIGASDLTAMGVTRSDHRARILQVRQTSRDFEFYVSLVHLEFFQSIGLMQHKTYI